jgi:hypothetical protein
MIYVKKDLLIHLYCRLTHHVRYTDLRAITGNWRLKRKILEV